MISGDFSAATSCGAGFQRWEAEVAGERTQRFKVGTASVTAWAYEVIDPAVSRDIELVRPPR